MAGITESQSTCPAVVHNARALLVDRTFRLFFGFALTCSVLRRKTLTLLDKILANFLNVKNIFTIVSLKTAGYFAYPFLCGFDLAAEQYQTKMGRTFRECALSIFPGGHRVLRAFGG